MKKLLFLICCFLLIAASSCKRVCYTCNQYCAYCIYKNDSTVTTKVCATGPSSTGKVDRSLQMLRDSGYNCTLLDNFSNVCDSKNSITGAIEYYHKQDYYCDPKQ